MNRQEYDEARIAVGMERALEPIINRINTVAEMESFKQADREGKNCIDGRLYLNELKKAAAEEILRMKQKPHPHESIIAALTKHYFGKDTETLKTMESNIIANQKLKGAREL